MPVLAPTKREVPPSRRRLAMTLARAVHILQQQRDQLDALQGTVNALVAQQQAQETWQGRLRWLVGR